MGGLQSCLQGSDSAEVEAGPQKEASTADHHPTISSKARSLNADAGNPPSVPWASQCVQDRQDDPWQEHVPGLHANKQQEHQVQHQHKFKPAAAAAAFPTAGMLSSTNTQGCASSACNTPAQTSSNEPQLEALLGFPSEPWMPLNPHESGPPRPACEDARLAVATFVAQLLDSVPHEPLDSLLQLACSMFNVSAALLVLCGDRCIRALRSHCSQGEFKGDPSWQNSFCGWTLSSQQPAVLVVNDTLQDARFADNVHVQSGAIRFYCGAPLVSSTGHRLGTLALVDAVPRTFDTSCLQALANIAELAVRELELQIAQQQQQQHQSQQQGTATAAGVIQEQQHQQQAADAQACRDAAARAQLLPPWLHAKQSMAARLHAGEAAGTEDAGAAGMQQGGQAPDAAAPDQQQPQVEPQQHQQQQAESRYPLQLRTAETVSRWARLRSMTVAWHLNQ
ncbi:GAF domain-like protein [Scenedesmus sp. NREL 46B-D3]|nr:GAF domain-like protein [Scenedesmus sp. NREL 46B-D3]